VRLRSPEAAAVVEHSLAQKLAQIAVRQVLHHDRRWLPLSNDAQHRSHVRVTDAAQPFHCLFKFPSEHAHQRQWRGRGMKGIYALQNREP